MITIWRKPARRKTPALLSSPIEAPALHRRSASGLALTLLTLLGAISPLLAGIDSPLEAQIERYIKSLRATGRISSAESTAWVVHDLSTGTQLASINASTPLQAASMVKPLIALAFFHQVKAGRLSYGSTSRRHLELMIQRSSNTSTNWVMRQVGGPAATKALLARHYPSVCRNLRLVEYIPASGRAYQNLASANDYMYFLAALWQKRLPYATEILRLMALPGTDRLFDKASRVPPGTRVYDKTGSTAMCCGDMGILVAQGTNGRSYPYIIIGIISRSSRTASYGSWIGLRSNVIREVSNLTYQYLKQRHPLR